MFGITVFSTVLIAAIISVMLLFSFSGHDDSRVRLPAVPAATDTPSDAPSDALNSVKVTTDTVQAVIASLSRPESYRRSVVVEIVWDGGRAVYNISVAVQGAATAIRIVPSVGLEKRVIVANGELYIWNLGDKSYYKGVAGAAGDAYRTADEMQMLLSYEDILSLDKEDILEAGYVFHGEEYCVYAQCRTPRLGYTRNYYVPVGLGLVTYAEDLDQNGNLVYSMTAGECVTGETDLSLFTLPDGVNVLSLDE